MRSFSVTGKQSLLAGMTVGFLHGAAIYLPLWNLLPSFYIVTSIVFIMVLEGFAIFMFFAVISGIIREDKRQEMERELLKTQLLFLHAQISPHFLYNALNTISAVCSRENAGEARRLVLRLADIFRRAARKLDDRVTLKEELDYIDSYLEIEKARFQDRLKIVKEVHISAALEETRIPFLVLQPLVENAIKHGISKKEAGGTLHIRVTEEKGRIKVEVNDDGVGTDKARLESVLLGKTAGTQEVGIGIRNINQRLIRFYGSDFNLTFECQPGKGMKVTVLIPVRETKGTETAL